MGKVNANFWINHLDLSPHPEGGYYREIFRSDEKIIQNCLPPGFLGSRSLYTSIYFLLKHNHVSHFHRIKSDEIWCFHSGNSLDIHIIDKEGNYVIKKLGLNPDENEMPQQIVSSGSWFGACLQNKNSYALVTCFVSPGFDFVDFELAKREELLKLYPNHKEIIKNLTH
jgi:uncharacterized protein